MIWFVGSISQQYGLENHEEIEHVILPEFPGNVIKDVKVGCGVRDSAVGEGGLLWGEGVCCVGGRYL